MSPPTRYHSVEREQEQTTGVAERHSAGWWLSASGQQPIEDGGQRQIQHQ